MSNSISVHYVFVISATYNYNNITVTGQETGIHTQQTTNDSTHTIHSHIHTKWQFNHSVADGATCRKMIVTTKVHLVPLVQSCSQSSSFTLPLICRGIKSPQLKIKKNNPSK